MTTQNEDIESTLNHLKKEVERLSKIISKTPREISELTNKLDLELPEFKGLYIKLYDNNRIQIDKPTLRNILSEICFYVLHNKSKIDYKLQILKNNNNTDFQLTSRLESYISDLEMVSLYYNRVFDSTLKTYEEIKPKLEKENYLFGLETVYEDIKFFNITFKVKTDFIANIYEYENIQKNNSGFLTSVKSGIDPHEALSIIYGLKPTPKESLSIVTGFVRMPGIHPQE